MDDVDLHLTQPDRGHDRPVDPRRPTGDHDRPGEELLGREGHGQDVVDAQVERPELGPQVAPAGQAKDRGHALAERVGGTQASQQARAVLVLHVDHGQVGHPVDEDRLGLGQALDGPHDEQAMIERELDQAHDQRLINKDQGRTGFARSAYCNRRFVVNRHPGFPRSISRSVFPPATCTCRRF